jgi:hypothetical protein
VLGPDHADVATALRYLAYLYYKQGRYDEAEPLYKRSLAITEKALGPDHPDIARSLNKLATLYDAQGRYEEALPIIRRTIDSRTANLDPTLSILLSSQSKNLISQEQSFRASYKVLQFSWSSAAAEAVQKLAQRFATGSSDLAKLVRKDQDLAVEADRLDKNLIAAVSKAPDERNNVAEDQIRGRLAEISSERKKLSDALAKRFPDYVALANPQPLTLEETQALLADDEAVIAFNIGGRSAAWVVTKTSADWMEIPVNAEGLNEEVQKLRQSLTFTNDEAFDATLSYKVYQQTFGPIAEKLKGKTRLSVLANGSLTSIPFGVLITSDPEGKALKGEDWLIRSYAVTALDLQP